MDKPWSGLGQIWLPVATGSNKPVAAPYFFTSDKNTHYAKHIHYTKQNARRIFSGKSTVNVEYELERQAISAGTFLLGIDTRKAGCGYKKPSRQGKQKINERIFSLIYKTANKIIIPGNRLTKFSLGVTESQDS